LPPAKFGFNGLGELVFVRTYARPKKDGTGLEKWGDTVERVVNGTFSMQKRHELKKGKARWSEETAQREAMDMFERMYTMKFLPPGRGLWAMGTALTETRHTFAALNNCAFVSTNKLAEEFASSVDKHGIDPFTFLMDAAMLGVGVGFDTLGAGKLLVVRPATWDSATTTTTPTTTPTTAGDDRHVIADSREGWVESVGALLRAWLRPASEGLGAPPRVRPAFDYSRIRKAGLPIKGFGGVSAGKEPLVLLHTSIEQQLGRLDGQPLSSRGIVDVMNLIGRCVVSGNVRRTAEIAFGSPDDHEYVALKDYTVNKDRAEFGWTSNNSVFARAGMDYSSLVDLVASNGEPGFMWLDNARKYGRMHPDDASDELRDPRAMGGNPCLEQTLESYELCCLVETFPAAHASLEDYLKTLRSAFLYAKTVSLAPTHWPESNAVMQRNRRIGCSMSGIAQFLTLRGEAELVRWCDAAYAEIGALDHEFSARFDVPRSIKTTCVKPSGTVSLLAGATPGIHFPEARFYIRRVRLAANSPLIPALEVAGYGVEPSATDPVNTVVVSVPVDAGDGIQSTHERSMREQMRLAAVMQRHWADNQVSCTVTFDPATEKAELAPALSEFESQLKGISFLPLSKHEKPFAQMPYEAITEAQFKTEVAKLKGDLNLAAMYGDVDAAKASATAPAHGNTKHPGVELKAPPDNFCDAEVCERL